MKLCINILSSLPSYLETVAVGIFAGIGAVFQESVLKSPTIFEGGGDIIGSPEVSVPAVITVAPCAAAVAVPAAGGRLRRKAVGIVVVRRIGVEVRSQLRTWLSDAPLSICNPVSRLR